MIKHTILGAASLGLVTACQVGPSLEDRETAYLSLSEAHWQDATRIVDDPLNPTIEISTRAGYDDQVFLFALKNDQFLRARIARDTGKVLIQGYVTHEDPHDWLAPSLVSFADIIDTRPVNTVDFEAYACGNGCQHYEEMVFDLSEADLQRLIKHAEKTGKGFVPFRIQGQTGLRYDGRFHINELRAMQAAVESVAG